MKTPSLSAQSPFAKVHRARSHSTDSECILVLQGAGALGAYQAGVFESRDNFNRTPSWVAGISIGSIIAAHPVRATAAARHFGSDHPGKRKRVVFQVDLFAATGALPTTRAAVTEREQDIRFSSRTRLNTTNELDQQDIAQAVKRLLAKLPAAWREDPDVLALSQLRCESAVDAVHLMPIDTGVQVYHLASDQPKTS